MNRENVSLVGMMGTFKSAAGRLLARELSYAFVDLDLFIERKAGKSIERIFAEDGADAFRDAEAQAVKECASYRETVIACGGGTVLRAENAACLRGCGVVVLLTASAEAIFERVKDSTHRPLLSGDGMNVENIRRIMKERAEKYRKAANFTVDNTELTSAETAAKIAELLKNY